MSHHLKKHKKPKIINTDIEKMLDGMLSELRLNYVDEKSKAPEKVEAKKEKEKPKAVKKKPKKK